ncbi:MAG: 16S rRNA (guanine(527)-N(7))-methyltransferase RsmG, partial [Deltaproteobacteria bacterium]|nr:16S rRNA (guanine(527)-N(7))-methyltransferase RsmG [Deltaproteobacteria bacterium]
MNREPDNLSRYNISSRNNPTFKSFLKLLSGKGIKKQGLALLSGPKQVGEVLQEFPEKCSGILSTADMPAPTGSTRREIETYQLAPDLFRELDLYGTDSPILIVKVKPFALWKRDQWPPGCTLL